MAQSCFVRRLKWKLIEFRSSDAYCQVTFALNHKKRERESWKKAWWLAKPRGLWGKCFMNEPARLDRLSLVSVLLCPWNYLGSVDNVVTTVKTRIVSKINGRGRVSAIFTLWPRRRRRRLQTKSLIVQFYFFVFF